MWGVYRRGLFCREAPTRDSLKSAAGSFGILKNVHRRRFADGPMSESLLTGGHSEMPLNLKSLLGGPTSRKALAAVGAAVVASTMPAAAQNAAAPASPQAPPVTYDRLVNAMSEPQNWLMVGENY